MTDRKPDIITKWSIKENTDATYTAKCSTMPNVELTADNVVVILGKIEGFLKTMYRDTTVDGGITGINAEYNVTKRQEFSLDTFGTEDTKDTEMPTDDPTPEPATDAPELHEEIQEWCRYCKYMFKNEDGEYICRNKNSGMVSKFVTFENACDKFELNKSGKLQTEHTCWHCKYMNYSSQTCTCKESERVGKHQPPSSAACDKYLIRDNDKMPTEAPELHEEPCIKPLAVPKKPRAKKEKKLFPNPCSTCVHLSSTNQCECPKSPNYHIIIKRPDDCTCVCCHETKEQYDARLAKGYKWKRITELVAGCAQCDRLSTGYCAGNKACEVCDNYHPRDDAGEECRTCKKLGGKLGYQQDGKDAYMCDCHKQPICLDDLSCYAYKER